MEKCKVELRIYELLGIKIFQKLTFLLEKIIHRNDNGYNENYHLKKKYCNGNVQDFKKFLFYNGGIHIRNILFIIIIILIKKIFKCIAWFDCILIILAVKDIYCVMLQRYNYIRIQNCIDLQNKAKERRINKKTEKIKSDISKSYDLKNYTQDINFINSFMKKLSANELIEFKEEDIISLRRIMGLGKENENVK